MTFAITSGDSDNHFQMNGDILEVNIPVDLDLSSSDPATFTLIIEATDSGSPTKSGTTTASLTVATSNDHTPVFGTTLPLGTLSVSRLL